MRVMVAASLQRSQDVALKSGHQGSSPLRSVPTAQSAMVPSQAGHFAGHVLPMRRVQFGTSVLQQEHIPVVDLSRFVSGDTATRMAFAQKIGEGLQKYGFVAVKGHGIPRRLFQQNYAQMAKVFQLDAETKEGYHHREIGSQRGSLPLGSETRARATGDPATAGQKIPDLKEAWQIGRSRNYFPAEVPTYEKKAMTLFNRMDHVGVQLLEAIGMYLGDKGYLKSLVVDDEGKPNGTHMMRAIHYPAVPPDELTRHGSEASFIRAAEHGDMNMITLLPESTNAGLQILKRDGSWLPVHAQEGHIIVNAGDMLALITAGTDKAIPSTRHKVVGTPQQATQSRYSIPMFIHPHHDKALRNLGTGELIEYTKGDLRQRCNTAGEFVYLSLKKHGKGTLSQETTYEQYRRENEPLING